MLEASGLGEATRGDNDVLPLRDKPPLTTACKMEKNILNNCIHSCVTELK